MEKDPWQEEQLREERSAEEQSAMADEREDEPSNEPLELVAAPFGPSEEALQRAVDGLLRHPDVRNMLEEAEHRVISFNAIADEQKSASNCPPDRFRATIFDYTNCRTLIVEGDLAALDVETPGEVHIQAFGSQPLPSEDEYAAALGVLMHDRGIAAAIEAGTLQPYRPMPPLIDVELPDGRIDRTLNIGLRSTDDAEHRFVGVRMFDGGLIWDHRDLPQPGLGECEPPPGVDVCPSSGSGGQVWVTVTQAGQTVWRFLVVRPSASSGTNGSGVELRYLDYRGKRVLYQAHVPILNVEYFADGTDIGCGPTYRDWQNSEACFEAPLGYDVIPGYRVCSTPAQTILDNGRDGGNFRGVAIYVQGQEVVLVSEMQAGWYRYISEWRLHVDGTIRPRFGFAGTANRCTCKIHHHHVYWRLDFDLQTSWNNLVEEFNDPPLFPPSNWHTKTYEIRRPRDPGHRRYWRVTNASTHDGYLVRPGPNDGAQTAFGVGDIWVLRWHPGEIDDGVPFTTNPAMSTAHIDNFKIAPEPVANADVVLWYAAHFLHDEMHDAGVSHWVGPDLVPTHPFWRPWMAPERTRSA